MCGKSRSHMLTISISSVLALVILILGISLYDWIRKSGDFAPTYQDSVEVEEPFIGNIVNESDNIISRSDRHAFYNRGVRKYFCNLIIT